VKHSRQRKKASTSRIGAITVIEGRFEGSNGCEVFGRVMNRDICPKADTKAR
jgi:hypothetical protein